MRHFKNEKNELFAFELDCFDNEGQVINQIAKKIINDENLVEITQEVFEEMTKIPVSKEQKILEINTKAHNEIIEKYPLWKQSNINADYTQYPESEIFKKNFEDMRLYINQIRAYADLEVMKL